MHHNRSSEKVPRLLLNPKTGKFLLFVALVVYLYTRLSNLELFPCYFHSDEAIETVNARGLVARGIFGPNWELPPLFFPVAWNYNLATTVWLHALSTWLFGESVFITRVTSSFFSILAPCGVALFLRSAGVRYWWLGAFALSAEPLWFFHSRTAFEVVCMVSLYSVFLWSYGCYRNGKFGYKWLVVLSASLAFYSYSAAQVIVSTTIVLLVVFDLRFHLKNWKHSLVAIAFGLFFIVPFILFRLNHVELLQRQLAMTGSFITEQISLAEKFTIFFTQYSRSLNPQFWFLEQDELIRHRMGELSQVPMFYLPFLILGFLSSLWSIKKPHSRILLAFYLASHMASAISTPTYLRSMAALIPMTCYCVLGFEVVQKFCVQILSCKLDLLLKPVLTCFFTLFTIQLLNYGVKEGCVWSKDYGLYGYQWGVQEVFKKLIPSLARKPYKKIYLSSSWAHTAETFLEYFKSDSRVKTMNIEDSFFDERFNGLESGVFIVTANEFNLLNKSRIFAGVHEESRILCPNQEPCFYAVTLEYVPNIQTVFEETAKARQKPLTAEVLVSGIQMEIEYPQLGSGSINDLFDSNSDTLLRGREAHPFKIKLKPKSPINLRTIRIISGQHSQLRVTALLGSKPSLPDSKKLKFASIGKEGIHYGFQLKVSQDNVILIQLEVVNGDMPTAKKANIHLNELSIGIE